MKTFPILTILLPVSWIGVPPLAGGMFLHFQAGTAVLLATGSIAITSIFNHHILYPAIDWSAITSIHHSLPAGFRCPPGVTVDFHFVSYQCSTPEDILAVEHTFLEKNRI